MFKEKVVLLYNPAFQHGAELYFFLSISNTQK